MEYTDDEYTALKERLIEAGATLLSEEICGTKTHRYSDGKPPLIQAGCGKYRIYSIPYVQQRANPSKGQKLVKGHVKLCADCDHIGQMPRFTDRSK